ncbi:hypothetical protein COCOR_04891 [Corallococcus coralloides DSM 2259]|uniref:Uncharacterized protein n=1 Tax=Corallococcus coralloides (strain ATCC 25202 / DSM 2259 / NBRC 100086 / M2) TaxID=1144275 RepID=H8MMB0_CORCM|nr:hypothetical protein [Corallococcus coralloides]AFE06080.1 hypothetical protein COCOR_04891 [Corallococcus coralloides DSM 2259]
MSSDASAFTWRRIRDSLDAYSPQSLASRLREALAPLRTGSIHTSRLKQAQNVVKDLLQAELGPWYVESGLPLGNEMLGGYCWCHSFFNQNPPHRTWDVDENIQLMLDALERIRSFLYALDGVYQASRRQLEAAADDKALRAKALAEGLVRTVDLTAETTSCEETWYQIAQDAMTWCIEAMGLPLSEATLEQLDTAFVFTSWIAPPPEALREAAARVAEGAV